MKRVIKFETRDGVLHDTYLRAEHHAEVVYTNEASKLASKLIKITEYTAMKDFLDAHLEDFVQLNDLKRDLILPTPEEDDE